MREELSDRSNLTTGVVWKKLIIFFLPIAAGTCIQQLYNAVDGLIVGRFVGTQALAAVGGSTSQIINVLIGFFVAMTSGAAVVIAQIYGAGRTEDVQRASGNAVAISALVGTILAVIGYFLSPTLLKLLKTPDETIEMSLVYLRIYFIGVPFILVLNMESNIMRSVGDSMNPFIYMVVGCVTNIILDFAFVYFFGWGVAGVAIATVIAQVVNMSCLTVILLRTEKAYRLDLGQLKLNGRYLSNMMKIGIPAGLQSSMYSVSNVVIQVAVNTLGTLAVASWSMTSKADGIYWAVSNALGAAVTSFIGQNFGAGKMDRVKQCVRQGLILSLSVTVVLSALIMFLARPILGILTPDAAVIEMSCKMMTYFVPYYFLWTLIEIFSSVLRGSGDATVPVIIIGIGICLFRVVWIATVFARFRTVAVVCLSYATSWVVTAAALLIYYRSGRWMAHSNRKLKD